jgi:hypothetical protein
VSEGLENIEGAITKMMAVGECDSATSMISCSLLVVEYTYALSTTGYSPTLSERQLRSTPWIISYDVSSPLTRVQAIRQI